MIASSLIIVVVVVVYGGLAVWQSSSSSEMMPRSVQPTCVGETVIRYHIFVEIEKDHHGAMYRYFRDSCALIRSATAG